MARQNRTGTPLQVYLTPELRGQLEELARRNKRAISVEVRTAVERYLESPEVIGGRPPVPAEAQPDPAPTPAPGRGRPPKASAQPAPAPEVVNAPEKPNRPAPAPAPRADQGAEPAKKKPGRGKK